MTESALVSKGPCPAPGCGSSDAYATYTDHHTHCFSCGHHTDPDGTKPPLEVVYRSTELLTPVVPRELSRRGLAVATCRHYGYGIAKDRSGTAVQVAQYTGRDGAIVAQKIRTPDKDFYTLGAMAQAGFFGQHLWPSRGKRLVITEGEIDAMSVAQCMSLKWPVVSVPTGAKGAAATIRAQLDWVNGFDEIVLWFDNDNEGRRALEECTPLFAPGKLKIAQTPGEIKDANELLTIQGAQSVLQCIWNAREYRPDGVVSGSDITLEELMCTPEVGWETPYPELNKLTLGMHGGELWLLTAGSGIGKSTDAREFLHKALSDGLRCGAVFLEENKATTAKALIAIDNDVRLADLRSNPDIISREQWAASHNKLIANGRYFAYDHFGSVESDNLMNRLEYLAVACKCDLIVLDHISIAVSGLQMDEGERRAIDVLMTRLRTLVERTGTRVLAISHLRKVGGGDKSFEQGGQISLDDLRGSGSLKQLSDTVIARERDQQAASAEKRDLALIRVLKCRFTGNTGPADYAQYDIKTGRVKAVLVAPGSATTPSGFDDATDDGIPF